MIKKAVLTLTLTPFLMVFSLDSNAATAFVYHTAKGVCKPDYYDQSSWRYTPASYCISQTVSLVSDALDSLRNNNPGSLYYYSITPVSLNKPMGTGLCSNSGAHCSYAEVYRADTEADIPENVYGVYKTDDQCSSENGNSFATSDASVYNYLASGGSVRTHGGACSVSSGGGVSGCTGQSDSLECDIAIVSESTGKYSEPNVGIDGSLSPKENEPSDDFETPEYLSELPGGCSDPSSCVTIGDTSYLVDWDSAPDYFSYVDSNGNTHSKSSSGGGGDTGGGGNDGGDPTDPTDPTDPGGDNGGGDNSGGDDSDDDNDSGGGSGGGSTVPDFEFDESGIIEAIGSAGRSNRNAINALSNDVTGALSDQTREINEQIDFSSLTVTDALSDQTSDVTDTIDGQTETITDSLDALGTTFTDALKGLGLGSIGDDTGDGDGDGDGEGEGEGEGEDGEGDGLLGGISKLLNRLVDKLASTFTEDLGDGDDLFNSSDMDETLDGVAAQEQEYTGEVNALMDEIGDGATSGIADQITSRLPSLPSGGCVPLQFGPMEISCQAFNTIKLWLTWIIYFWTVVSIVDTFFRSEQRTA